jgi:hypothetical protein
MSTWIKGHLALVAHANYLGLILHLYIRALPALYRVTIIVYVDSYNHAT